MIELIILALIICLPLLIWRGQRKAQERADLAERRRNESRGTEKWSGGIKIEE
jgi:hypothetical protein